MKCRIPLKSPHNSADATFSRNAADPVRVNVMRWRNYMMAVFLSLALAWGHVVPKKSLFEFRQASFSAASVLPNALSAVSLFNRRTPLRKAAGVNGRLAGFLMASLFTQTACLNRAEAEVDLRLDDARRMVGVAAIRAHELVQVLFMGGLAHDSGVYVLLTISLFAAAIFIGGKISFVALSQSPEPHRQSKAEHEVWVQGCVSMVLSNVLTALLAVFLIDQMHIAFENAILTALATVFSIVGVFFLLFPLKKPKMPFAWRAIIASSLMLFWAQAWFDVFRGYPSAPGALKSEVNRQVRKFKPAA